MGDKITMRLKEIGWECLRTIFERNGKEETKDARKLYSETLDKLYSLPCITSVFQSRSMRLVGYIACMMSHYTFAEHPEGKST
jgi:hypothetical protein